MQRFSIVSLAGALGLGNQLIQAVIDDQQVGIELALPRHKVLGKRQIPVGNVEGGSVLSLFQHPIHSLTGQNGLQHVANYAADGSAVC